MESARATIQKTEMDAQTAIHKENPEEKLIPLHIAVRSRNKEIVEQLLRGGVNVDERNSWNWTALHAAAEEGDFEIAALLLSRGATVDARTLGDWTPFLLAAQEGHLNLMELFLNCGADLEAVDDKGWTALHIASQKPYNYHTVEFLLKKGAQKEATCTFGNWTRITPLHVSIYNNNKDITNLLLQYGANLEAETSGKSTPIEIAAFVGNMDIVQMLTERGANLEHRDDQKCTALHHASQKGYQPVVSFLLQAIKQKRQNPTSM